MNKKEALKDMQERCRICKRDALPSEEDCEKCYFPIAIECISKQIPKKANHTRNEKFVYWNVPVYECPICKEEIRFVHNEIKHCALCGQALIHEVEEDD